MVVVIELALSATVKSRLPKVVQGSQISATSLHVQHHPPPSLVNLTCRYHLPSYQLRDAIFTAQLRRLDASRLPVSSPTTENWLGFHFSRLPRYRDMIIPGRRRQRPADSEPHAGVQTGDQDPSKMTASDMFPCVQPRILDKFLNRQLETQHASYHVECQDSHRT